MPIGFFYRYAGKHRFVVMHMMDRVVYRHCNEWAIILMAMARKDAI